MRVGGNVSLIGTLTSGAVNPMMILRKTIRLQGIYVGSREMFEAMNRAMTARQIHPVIDRVFPAEQAALAHGHMESNRNFGKILLAWSD